MSNKKATFVLVRFPFAIFNFLLDIFFPKKCVGCGKAETFLCSTCAKEIEILKTPVCANCGKINKFGEYCPSCKKKLNVQLSGLIIAAKYDSGPTKEIIHHFKYSGFTELTPILGEIICERLRGKIPSGKIEVVPVPLYKKREAARGFNQAELIARFVSKKLNLKGGMFLKRTKNTKSQVFLKREERLKNLSNSFVCIEKKLVKNKTILLIDDVTTTGTTLNECALVLKEAGAKQVWGVVVAKRM